MENAKKMKVCVNEKAEESELKIISTKLPGLTWRALLISAIGSMIITASSMYVALKISALPWPTVFVAVLSLAILRVWGKTNIHEINIAKTGMSAGAMIAGGVAFTLPGFWIAGVYQPYQAQQETVSAWLLPKLSGVLGVTLAGTLLGTLLCWLIRNFYLYRLQLSYPIGTAAAETLRAAESGGSSGKLMFTSLGLSSLFTLLRDGVASLGISKLIPERLLFNISGFSVGVEFSPLGIAIGYLIGFVPTLIWFLGAITTNWFILNLLVKWQIFADATVAGNFNFTFAIGLMVGAGVGILLGFVHNIYRSRSKSERKVAEQDKSDVVEDNHDLYYDAGRATKYLKIKSFLFIFAIGCALAAGLSLPLTIAICVGIVFATAMSATITGQTGINPMEIFAIIVLLALKLFFTIDSYHAFLVTGMVAVACGYAGDLMNDYQAGKILHTHPTSQLVSELVGGFVGAVVATVGLFAIIYQYGGVGADTGLSAVQAHTVTALLGGVGDQRVFIIAAVLGCLLFLCKIPSMIFGIGMLLGIPLSTAVFIGGLLHLVLGKQKKNGKFGLAEGQLVAAGMLGGEGIMGTLVAIITMLRG